MFFPLYAVRVEIRDKNGVNLAIFFPLYAIGVQNRDQNVHKIEVLGGGGEQGWINHFDPIKFPYMQIRP